MKNLLRFLSFLLVGALVLGLAAVLLPDQYDGSFQRVLVTQYDYFKSLGAGKIVFVGDSALSFGLDLDRMEQLTGRPCAILGNHAGYGITYLLEMTRANLQPGDVVVIEIDSISGNGIGADLLLTGIGKRYELYRYFRPAHWPAVLEAWPAYLKRSLERWLDGAPAETGDYSAGSYDARGNMTLRRRECWIPDPFDEAAAERFNTASYGSFTMDPGFLAYLQSYVQDCAGIGVPVYFTAVCALDEAVVSSEDQIEAFTESWKQQLPAPYISDQKDYIFPREYMYDAILHCNTEGARYRTEQLYRDLAPWLAIPGDAAA